MNYLRCYSVYWQLPDCGKNNWRLILENEREKHWKTCLFNLTEIIWILRFEINVDKSKVWRTTRQHFSSLRLGSSIIFLKEYIYCIISNFLTELIRWRENLKILLLLRIHFTICKFEFITRYLKCVVEELIERRNPHLHSVPTLTFSHHS